MKNFTQAFNKLTAKKNVLCSHIPREEAKAMFGKKVNLKEKSSKICFEALVVDYCFEDQKGIIVRLDKTVAETLTHKDVGAAERNPNQFVEMDLRDIHSGKFFELVRE